MARHIVRVLALATLALLLTGSVRLVQNAGAADGAAAELTAFPGVAPGSAGPGVPEGSREIPELRKRDSRTYLAPNGTHVAQVFLGSVNYRDANGDWQPIDNALTSTSVAGYAHANKANRYKLHLPLDLGGAPVKVSDGEEWVSFKMDGAKGAAAVSENAARYRDVFPGVEVAYAAQNDFVKETVTLAGASAQSSFVYTVRTSRDLVAKANGNRGIDFLSSSGEAVFSFAPPFMVDSSGARSEQVTLQLAQLESGYSLRVVADRRWLDAAVRKWPVVIDPNLIVRGAALDCYITNGALADTSTCADTVTRVGTSDAVRRALLKFNVQGVLPSDARILQSHLHLYLRDATTATAAVAALEPTREWGNEVTWNKANGLTPWTSPGGDFNPTPAFTHPAVGGQPGWRAWTLTQLIRGWTQGTVQNRGVLVKQASEGSAIDLRFHSSRVADPALKPAVSIYYNAHLGERPYYSFVDSVVNPRLQLRANVASGELIVRQRQVAIPGTGLDFDFDQIYNSRFTRDEVCGHVWRTNSGSDLELATLNDGSLFLKSESGFSVFQKRADGTFVDAPGLNASLVRTQTGYTVRFHRTGEKYNFVTGRYAVASQVDTNGNTITFRYTRLGNGCERIDTITDTRGRVTTFGYADATAYQPTTITDPAGRQHRYVYSNGQLSEYWDTRNAATRYFYDASQNLIQIDHPGGSTQFTYDSDRRVTSIRHLADANAATWVTTRFTYDSAARKTIVTDANGNASTYYYDAEMRVTRVVDPLGHETRASYTANSDLLTTTSAVGGVTTNSYDASNNLRSTTLPTGARTTWEYADPVNPYLPTRMTNAEGYSFTYAYDGNGNLSRTTNQRATQNTSSATYNLNGTISTQTDARGNVTRYDYHPSGELQRVTPPAPVGPTTYTYDNLSRPTSRTEGNGHSVSYDYALAFGDKVWHAYDSKPGLGTVQTTYSYDAAGRTTQMQEPSGTSTFSYDNLGRLRRETKPGTGNDTTYTYDPAGNLTSLADGRGVISYTHYPTGETKQIIDQGGTTSFEYDADGNRTKVTHPNAITQEWSYDLSGRLKSTTSNSLGAVIRGYVYSYQGGGQDRELLRTETESGRHMRVKSYGYNPVGELTSAITSVTGGEIERYLYDYDGSGNRTVETHSGIYWPTETTTYNYDPANLLQSSETSQPSPSVAASLALESGDLAETTGETASGLKAVAATYNTEIFEYDASGNRTRDRDRTFTYNAQGQTGSITPTPGAQPIAMDYVGPGQDERISAGLASFTQQTLGVSSKSAAGLTTFFTRDESGAPLSLHRGTQDYALITDGVGSVVAVADEFGQVVNNYDYNPFGETVTDQETVENPFGYLGLEEDDQADLYVTAEGGYYDPVFGVLTQVDIEWDPSGLDDLSDEGWDDDAGVASEAKFSGAAVAIGCGFCKKAVEHAKKVAGNIGRSINAHRIELLSSVSFGFMMGYACKHMAKDALKQLNKPTFYLKAKDPRTVLANMVLACGIGATLEFWYKFDK